MQPLHNTCRPRNRQKSRVISGVEVVTIPLQDYADLLDSKRQLAERAIRDRRVMSPRRSKIERNPEVAIFLADKFGSMSVKDALRLCLRKFGKAATPSPSAAYRYWDRIRKEALNAP